MTNEALQQHNGARPTRLASRVSGVIALWILIAALLVPASAGATPANEADFIAQVNATRAGVGLSPLQADVQLTNLARGWAEEMRGGVCGEGNFICHASPISAGVTHNWAKLGENVGTGPDVASVMDAFIASPGHYANIVDPEFTHIGVGVVWDGGRLYTTHRFMKLQDAPAPTTTTTPPTTTTAPPATAAPTTTTAAPQTADTPATTAAPTTTAAPIDSDPQDPPSALAAVNTDGWSTEAKAQRVEVVLAALIRLES